MDSWYHVRKMTGNATAEIKPAKAFDLEDIPDEFTCPICLEIPPEEIYQCVNGHTVCKLCYDTTNANKICAHCRSSMAPGGSLIRNRVLENILDKVLFACPFKKNGCLETFSREEIRDHADICFKDGNCVQLCHHLGFQETCDYWIRTTKPLDVVEHMIQSHQAASGNGEKRLTKWNLPQFHIRLLKQGGQKQSPSELWAPVHVKAHGGHFLIVWLYNPKDKTVSFVGLRIDKPVQGQVENEIEFRIHSKSATMHALKWKVPVLPILNLGEMINQFPFRIPAEVLGKYYVGTDGILKVAVDISQPDCTGSSKKRKNSDNEAKT